MSKQKMPAGAYKIRVCKKGSSCGYSCISESKTCRVNLPGSLASSLDIKASKLGSTLPEGEELVRLSREWTDSMGLVNNHDKEEFVAKYHDDQHILVHKLLGKSTPDWHPEGKNRVTFKEETFVEMLNWEYKESLKKAIRGSRYKEPTREEKLEVIKQMYYDHKEYAEMNGLKKALSQFDTPEKIEKRAEEVLSEWEKIEQSKLEKALSIVRDMEKGKYDNYSERVAPSLSQLWRERRDKWIEEGKSEEIM